MTPITKNTSKNSRAVGIVPFRLFTFATSLLWPGRYRTGRLRAAGAVPAARYHADCDRPRQPGLRATRMSSGFGDGSDAAQITNDLAGVHSSLLRLSIL